MKILISLACILFPNIAIAELQSPKPPQAPALPCECGNACDCTLGHSCGCGMTKPIENEKQVKRQPNNSCCPVGCPCGCAEGYLCECESRRYWIRRADHFKARYDDYVARGFSPSYVSARVAYRQYQAARANIPPQRLRQIQPTRQQIRGTISQYITQPLKITTPYWSTYRPATSYTPPSYAAPTYYRPSYAPPTPYYSTPAYSVPSGGCPT